ncbi:MAG: hypothetical protein AAF411_24410 [Myxococcota bacterium]
MTSRPSDTSPDAWSVQLQVWRRMGPQRRLDVMAAMSEELVALRRSGIRARHPECSDEAVRLAEIRQRLGDALFTAAYPNARRWDP